MKLLSAGIALGTGTSDQVAAAPLQTIRIGSIWVDITSEDAYAAELNLFKQAGLDAQLVVVPNGAAASAAIASGNLEFGVANIVALSSAHEHRLPFTIVAPAGAYSTASPTAAMVVAKKSALRSAADCSGKSVAVVLLKQLGEIAMRAWLDENGVDSRSVKIFELPYSEMDAALVAGRIDVACIEEPVLSQTLAADGRLLAKGYDAIAPQFCEAAWFCTNEYAQAHPDVVRAFASVIARTASWANKNHEQSAKILEKYGNASLPPGMHRCYFPERLRASDFQPVVNAAAKYGVLKATFPVDQLFAPGLT